MLIRQEDSIIFVKADNPKRSRPILGYEDEFVIANPPLSTFGAEGWMME